MEVSSNQLSEEQKESNDQMISDGGNNWDNSLYEKTVESDPYHNFQSDYIEKLLLSKMLLLSDQETIQLEQKLPIIKKFIEIILEPSLNLVKAMFDTTQVAEFDRTAAYLLNLFQVVDQSKLLIKAAMKHEILRTNEASTLFRGGTITIKLLSLYARRISEDYLKNTLKHRIEEIASWSPGRSLEIDPEKLVTSITSSSSVFDESVEQAAAVSQMSTIGNSSIVSANNIEHIIDQNSKLLMETASLFFSDIVHSVNSFPIELRDFCSLLRSEIAEKFTDKKVPILAVGGFLFLRLLNPFIISSEKAVTPESRRNLILIGKLLQNLANQLMFGEKEKYMQRTNSFIMDNLITMQAFVEEISSVKSPITSTTSSYQNYNATTPFDQSISMTHRINNDDAYRAVNGIYKQVFLDQNKLRQYLQKKISKNDISETSFSGSHKEVGEIQIELDQLLVTLSHPPLLPEHQESAQQKKSEDSSLPVPLSNSDLVYQQYLIKARKLAYSDITALDAVFSAGVDSERRSVIVFVASRIPVKEIDMEKFFLYIIQLMDPIVENNYVFIYIHTTLDEAHRPSIGWIKNAYNVFNRKYKKNLKDIYIVNANAWVKFLFGFLRPFLSSKFWKKLHYVESVDNLLANYPNLPIEQLRTRLLQKQTGATH